MKVRLTRTLFSTSLSIFSIVDVNKIGLNAFRSLLLLLLEPRLLPSAVTILPLHIHKECIKQQPHTASPSGGGCTKVTRSYDMLWKSETVFFIFVALGPTYSYSSSHHPSPGCSRNISPALLECILADCACALASLPCPDRVGASRSLCLAHTIARNFLHTNRSTTTFELHRRERTLAYDDDGNDDDGSRRKSTSQQGYLG